MNQINPAKLTNSKWTAVKPVKKEKHFLVTEVGFDEDGSVTSCTLEAVMSKNVYDVNWRDFKNEKQWRQGWK